MDPDGGAARRWAVMCWVKGRLREQWNLAKDAVAEISLSSGSQIWGDIGRSVGQQESPSMGNTWVPHGTPLLPDLSIKSLADTSIMQLPAFEVSSIPP